MLRIHGVKVGSERNYVALVTMTSGDQTSIVYLNMIRWVEILHRGSERMDGDKVDILRVLAVWHSLH